YLGRLGLDRCQDGLITKLFRPAPFPLQPAKNLARRDPVTPGAEQLRFAQPAQLPVDPQQNLLEDVFGKRRIAHEAYDVAVERLLDGLEQCLKGIPVPDLGSEHPQRFLFLLSHRCSPTLESPPRL